jgi:PhnB protein
MLPYADAAAAIAFLCRAFGFEERFRFDMPDGRVGHAELALGDDVVMVASVWREGGLASPLELPALHAQLYCRVDDVDAHFARARTAGATLVGAPEDQEHGMRTYRALDPEGHRWVFAGPLRGS